MVFDFEGINTELCAELSLHGSDNAPTIVAQSAKMIELRVVTFSDDAAIIQSCGQFFGQC
ncbi:hypothetical protein AA106555_0761 [Neokomagataea thailandica NBRC 106555]|uniref:Uncharacterized protein n=1 Tax=Neokomagataea thailandica NBRC 106555 TaxID=1223520 RepID=A0ABQ0QP21_9PROT|nr:hypothetical protein AA106555_0761 [Neokomagataea thailandica NBRC 106555]